MTDASADADFSLTYEVELADLRELQTVNAGRKRRRARVNLALVTSSVVAVAFTAITVALDQPSSGEVSSGAATWMGAADTVIWLSAILAARASWRLSPRWLARRNWHANTEFPGRHQDEVGARGVTITAPNGIEIFIPWTVIARVRETKNAFYLLDESGRARAALPKRGLRSPDLIPALRAFLNNTVSAKPSAAAPGVH